jgi:hypothetical protein
MKRQRGLSLPVVAGALVLLAGLAVAAFLLWPRAEAGAAGVAPATAATVAADTYTGIDGTIVRFADVASARAVLGADDAWLQRSGSWQRAVLMARTSAPDAESFRAWQRDAAQPWSADARLRWHRALEAIAPAFNRLKVPLPREVLLIHSSGSESANQPHTRANAVVLPVRFDQQAYSDAEVLAHELFHVVSRHQPELANRLYDLIGYVRVGELEWPAAWLPLRIVNQDAPYDRHLMSLKLRGGREATVMPVVVTANAKLPPANGDTLLELMEVRLLEVEPGAQATRAVLRQGQPVWYDPQGQPDFLAHLGGNTDYVQHPDETIADNFMFLVSGRAVKNPALLRRIEAVLQANRP